MKIVEYEDKYLENVRDLLVELEEYIVSIDEDNLDQVGKDYREKLAIIDLEEVKDNNGKCFLAIQDSEVIGLIMGIERTYEETDYLDYKCPKSGEITELIVTKKVRARGVGKELMNKMEEYFKNIGCEYIFVDVFGYNINGINFYEKNDYHTRMLSMVKKVKYESGENR